MTAGPVTVRLIANSGVYIRWGEKQILLDAIYGENQYFSPPQKEIKKAVFGLTSRYRNVEHVLFTHRHTDHFHAPFVDEYAVYNAVKGIYVPVASPDPNSYLEDRRPLPKAAGRGVLREVVLREGETVEYTLAPDCTATFLRCRHLDGDTYDAVSHCAVLLTFEQKRLLFAADADYCRENSELFRTLGALNAVFVTPLLYAVSNGRNLLEKLGTEQVVLYHIPYEEDDSTGLRPLARRLAAENTGPALMTALMEPEQELIF